MKMIVACAFMLLLQPTALAAPPASTHLRRLASPKTAAPTLQVATPKTASPTTSKPSPKPSAAPTPLSPNDIAAAALTQARAAITKLIKTDKTLSSQFLRMGFHDCVGGCDGCIDMANPDNNGLANAISVLVPVVAQFANKTTGLTRADIWALATVVAADVANHGNVTMPISFNMTWFGRINCEVANKVCKNGQGQVVTCGPTAGPNRTLPSVNLNTVGIFNFFATNFGFTQRQTVAIMGAHSIGSLVRTNSGIDGPRGWTGSNVKLDNGYYRVLQEAPWARFNLDNTGLSVPSRNYWVNGNVSSPLVMTNADIALVRQLDDSNMNPTTGAVSCLFQAPPNAPAHPVAGATPVCPSALGSSDIVSEFLNNDVWLDEFQSTLDLMTTNGYSKTACVNGACPLTPIPAV